MNRPPFVNVYAQLVESGAEIDSYESDLYAKLTPETLRIVKTSGWYASTFTSPRDNQPWIEVPFAFEPFWVGKS